MKEGLPINWAARHLAGLTRVEEVRETAHQRSSELTKLVVEGLNQVVERFNRLSWDDPELALMPGTQKLKEALKDKSLPKVEELTGREVILGMREAEEAMLMGQQIKDGSLESSAENLKKAIRTPAMDTGDMALAFGTAAHIVERAMFEHFKDKGVVGPAGGWKKDNILFALVDCALLMRAEWSCGEGEDAIIFPVIITPNEMSDDGGLGWRKEEDATKFMERYSWMVARGEISSSRGF